MFGGEVEGGAQKEEKGKEVEERAKKIQRRSYKGGVGERG